jgi:Zn-dependent protease/predicted transcriptional regulator
MTIQLFSAKGIRIKIHWTFIILLVWVGGAMTVNNVTGESIFWSLVFILLMLMSVVLHEVAQIWVGQSFGVLPTEITLLPVGGISVYEKYPEKAKEELLINLAGPAVNLAIAGALVPFIKGHLPVWQIVNQFDVVGETALLYKLHLVNFGLFAVNLLPVFPFDGGHILRVLLGFTTNYFRATAIVVVTGKILGVIFLILGIYYLNLMLLLVGLLILSAVRAEEYMLYLQLIVKDLVFNDIMTSDTQSLQANATVHQAMGTLMINNARQFLVMEGGKPVGTVQRIQIINEVAEKKYETPVRKLMKENLIYFKAEDNVRKEFKRLAASPYRFFPIMKNNVFVGVVSFLSILEYMLLHNLAPQEHKKLKALINKI